MSRFVVTPGSLDQLAEQVWDLYNAMSAFKLPLDDYECCGDPTVAEYVSDFGQTMREATQVTQLKTECIIEALQTAAKEYRLTEQRVCPGTGGS